MEKMEPVDSKEIEVLKLWEDDGSRVALTAKEAVLRLEQSPYGKQVIAAQLRTVVKRRAGLDDKVCFECRPLDNTREEIIKNPHTKVYLFWGDTDQMDFDTDKTIVEMEKVIKEYREFDPKSNAKFLLTIIRDRGENNINKEY